MPADPTYQPKIQMRDGGDRLAVASGGTLDIETGGVLSMNGSDIAAPLAALAALSAAEVGVLDAVTPGTVAASKAVVVDANKDVSSFRNVGMAGALTFGAGGTLVSDHGIATSTAAAATIDKMSGIITTEALTTAADTAYSFTLTNSHITANSNLMVQVGYGTATTGHPNVRKVTPGAGSAVIVIHNDAAAAALNGTLIIQFFLPKP